MTEKIKAELEETIQGLFQKEDRLREFMQRLVQKALVNKVVFGGRLIAFPQSGTERWH